ncbi:MAG: type II secretion system minor pseudopilin GspK, partial [Enterovibrio sp.]
MTKHNNVRLYMRHQQGVALLIVMLLMALMTGLAASMASRMFVNFNRVESQLNYQQAYWFALSIEELAKFGVQDSFSNDDTVTLSQPWAVRDQVYPLDQGEATGSVYDQQACFNLNALYKSQSSSDSNENPILVTMLQRLIESQGVESQEAEIAATSTWEFIDKNNNIQSSAGVEDSEYESRTPPYVTANGYLSDVSEWRAIYGVSQQTYQKVAPFLCALPTSDLKVNINTVEEKDAPLLAAML